MMKAHDQGDVYALDKVTQRAMDRLTLPVGVEQLPTSDGPTVALHGSWPSGGRLCAVEICDDGGDSALPPRRKFMVSHAVPRSG
ncbi:hypothetical protein ACFYTC_23460 [Actinomadura nitritigenes]|uniref:hypothetical protein n=1 Tax=Actinomadura nitritigenes TaxID=134602 RepID=UPI0036877E1F